MKKFWISILTILALSLVLATTVFAAEKDFTVTISGPAYCGGTDAKIEPIITSNGVTLRNYIDYTLSYTNTNSVGTASVTVTGKGAYTGITKTESYQIFRNDISKVTCTFFNTTFNATEVKPTVYVYMKGETLVSGRDYVIYYENNYNIGTAYAHIVGIGNYYGSKIVPFTISTASNAIRLDSYYVGQADGALDINQPYYTEQVIFPGTLKATLYSFSQGSIRNHIAYYELYKIVGEEAVLVATYESPYGQGDTTAFNYDFSSVYEDDAAEGGAIYLLSYAWVVDWLAVYAGNCALIIPAKIPDATSMVMEQLPDIDDPFQEYFAVYGPDGNIGVATWSVSDPSIATIENGVLTKLAPGTVTVTATYGNLSASMDVTIEANDLRKAQILEYDPETAQTTIAYDNILLSADKEYTYSVETNSGILEVTATGKNNFYGYIMRQFDSVTGAPIGHTHTFREVCSERCTTCSFTRTCSHTKGTQLTRDRSGHWYLCSVCGGGKTDYSAHIPSAEDPEVCTVCGPLNIPGDLNDDVNLDDADALHLLRHTLFPTRYPVTKDADVNKDGEVTDADALYLLRHTLFPTRYPLYPA